MIKGRCRSNKDSFRESSAQWPEMFVAVPRIGEFIANENGLMMRVMSITHKVRNVRGIFNPSGPIESYKEAYVEIELG